MQTRGRHLIYFLVDGAHARFVERSSRTGQYVTVRRIDGSSALETLREEQRDEQPGRSFESAGGARHAVGREDAYRRAKSAFAARAVAGLNELLTGGAFDGVVLVAPSRLIPVLRAHLGRDVDVAKTVPRNLIKTPDHDLDDWLTTV